MDTSIFLSILFRKFRVSNLTTRRCVVDVYTPIIRTILNDLPSNQRIPMFRQLIPIIKDTIIFLDVQQDEATIDAVKFILSSSLKFTNDLMKTQTNESNLCTENNVFDDIMRQVNFDDTVCDIGVCITQLNDDPKDIDTIYNHLNNLIVDYNSISDTPITLEGLLADSGIHTNGSELEL